MIVKMLIFGIIATWTSTRVSSRTKNKSYFRRWKEEDVYFFQYGRNRFDDSYFRDGKVHLKGLSVLHRFKVNGEYSCAIVLESLNTVGSLSPYTERREVIKECDALITPSRLDKIIEEIAVENFKKSFDKM